MSLTRRSDDRTVTLDGWDFIFGTANTSPIKHGRTSVLTTLYRYTGHLREHSKVKVSVD